MLTINLADDQFDTRAANKVLELVKSKFKPVEGTINIRVIDSAEVKRLNLRYAGQDQPTDVLAFGYDNSSDNQSDGNEIGDVVISDQHIKSQSKVAGTDEATELALLALHGTLHLLGYDHAQTADLDKMDKLQAQLMDKAGLTYRNFGWKS